MNRRSFFTKLASGLVVSAAPTLFLPKLVKPAWKPLRRMCVINPEWQNATYEIGFMFHAGKWQFIQDVPKSVLLPPKPYPVRGNHFDVNDQLIPIPPFILV